MNPGIAENILSVHVMGGAVYTAGNIKSDWPSIDNSVAEWNIWVDPVAASEVFSAGLLLHLTPLDATNRVIWTQAEVSSWASSETPEGILAAGMLQWMISNWYADGAYVWDLVAALHAADPGLCTETPLALVVNTAPGPKQGQTAVTSGTPNVLVCLEPDIEKMKAQAAALFGK
jgi:pyrimidine-specific ribonucleoside hydrolase